MQKVTVKFNYSFFIPPTSKLQFGYLYYYDLIFPNGNVESKTIEVYASDVLSMIWKLDFYKEGSTDAEKILLQFAKATVIEKFKESTLNDREEVVLLTATQPSVRPYHPSELKETKDEIFEIEPDEKPLFQEIKDNKLAASIIEVRDIINAIFAAKHKVKLLLLNQERNLLDFFKSAKTEEEYSHRIASLGQVSRYLNIDILRSITGEADTNVGSVALLGKYLKTLDKSDTDITDILKNIGYIRKGYPIHFDIAEVIAGYRYFKLNYPVHDFEHTWTTLLNQYLLALKQLYEILAEKYSA